MVNLKVLLLWYFCVPSIDLFYDENENGTDIIIILMSEAKMSIILIGLHVLINMEVT